MSENLSGSSYSTEGTPGTTASDVGQTLGAAEEKGTQRYAAAREKVREQWAVAKEDLDHLKQKAMDYSQTAARATNTFAHDHPWTTAGAAVGVGALIGWLVTRRGSDVSSSR